MQNLAKFRSISDMHEWAKRRCCSKTWSISNRSSLAMPKRDRASCQNAKRKQILSLTSVPNEL